MRPIRLELEGFSSFRDHTELDFSDAELFVLSGPTGAGKSSIIDAITFALFGSVPRYGKKAVAPIVSKGKNEARVRFDFIAGGTEYTAVRAVRLLAADRATTKEARLESGEKVLADGAQDVSEAVSHIIGLPFEHFTRCVVLPQGEFQEFLHQTPADRQEMLVRLLDLGLYGEVATAARRRADHADGEAELLRRRLDEDFGDVSAAAIEEAKGELKVAKKIAKDLHGARGTLDELRAATRSAERAVSELKDHLAALRRIKMPRGTESLAENLETQGVKLAEAEEAFKAAVLARRAAERSRSKLPERAEVQAKLRDYEQLDGLEAKLTDLGKALAEAHSQQAAAKEKQSTLATRLAEARTALAEAQHKDSALRLAQSLEVGQPCPVCLREVEMVPAVEVPKDLSVAEETVEVGEELLESAKKAATTADRHVGTLSSRKGDVDGRAKALRGQLKGAPPIKKLSATLTQITGAEKTLSAAQHSDETAEKVRDTAARKLETVQTTERQAWSQYEEARGTVTKLDPPTRSEGDLLSSWEALTGWTLDAIKNAEVELDEAGRAEEVAKEKESELFRELADNLRTAGVKLRTGEDPFEAAQRAKADAEVCVKNLNEQARMAKKARKDLKLFETQERTGRALARLLGAREFEGWLMGRALRALVNGASGTLKELSSGAYSLTVDARNEFTVVDHMNADELRTAKSLSGGETFLAALSLALALSDHVAELGARGGSRLDALFLDEGFGALDPDTLDVVATTLEELGARGRTIGLVTHVRELAERMPVRFEVRKEGNVSSVTKSVA